MIAVTESVYNEFHSVTGNIIKQRLYFFHNVFYPIYLSSDVNESNIIPVYTALERNFCYTIGKAFKTFNIK